MTRRPGFPRPYSTPLRLLRLGARNVSFPLYLLACAGLFAFLSDTGWRFL